MVCPSKTSVEEFKLEPHILPQVTVEKKVQIVFFFVVKKRKNLNELVSLIPKDKGKREKGS